MPTRGVAGKRSAEPTPARLQPLLLAAGVAAVLPALSRGSASTAAIGVLTLLAVVSVGVWALVQTAELSTGQRKLAGNWMAVLSVGALLVVLASDGRYRPEVYLLPAAALVCSLASIRSRSSRWALQIVAVGGVAGALGAAGRDALQIGVSVGLLASVVVLGNLLASELRAARRAELGAHADAERRTELLEAVRDLPGSSSEAAIEATLRTLRSLAFDSARVAVLRNGSLHEVGGDDGGEPGPPIPRGEGLKWRAIEEDRTVTSSDYQRDPARREGRPDLRSAVVAPIRVSGHPAGAVLGGRNRPGAPTAAEIEVAEVLAAHLGGVLDTESQMRRQRQLLDRMAELDHMRSGFARQVSAELRDPLTIVRTVGEALSRHSHSIDSDRRRVLLEQMCDHADDLRQTIDALLDFSRLQASRKEAEMVSLPLSRLLAPVLRATGAACDPPLAELQEDGPVVAADVELVRHALEIVLVAGVSDVGREPVATVVVRTRARAEVGLHIERRDGTIPSTLVRSLVSQLLVAGGATLAEGVDPVVLLRVMSVERETVGG